MSEKYSKERLLEAIQNSMNICDVLRFLGIKIAGGHHSHISSKIKKLKLDTSHFTGSRHMVGKKSPAKLIPKEILVLNRRKGIKELTSRLRYAMIEAGIKYQCRSCKIANVWNEKPITLEIDHINGNSLDNRIKNLRFLCPNCHSQEPIKRKVKS